MHPWRSLAVVPCLFLLGCGASGPEVRVTSDPGEWAPATVLVLPPLGASTAIPAGGTYPEGVYAVTLPEAVAATASALTGALSASTTTVKVSQYREGPSDAVLSGAGAGSATAPAITELFLRSAAVSGTQPVTAAAPAKPRTADLIETVSR